MFDVLKQMLEAQRKPEPMREPFNCGVDMIDSAGQAIDPNDKVIFNLKTEAGLFAGVAYAKISGDEVLSRRCMTLLGDQDASWVPAFGEIVYTVITKKNRMEGRLRAAVVVNANTREVALKYRGNGEVFVIPKSKVFRTLTHAQLCCDPI